jgi:putative DNA primase/helicase
MSCFSNYSGGDERQFRLSDKDVTDAIIANHKFFCDGTNKNLPLYVWMRDRWSNDMAEAVILKELADIFEDEEEHHKMSLAKTVEFIKGSTMDVKIAPLPLNLVPVKNGLYNINTNTLLPHDPQFFYTNVIPWDYEPAAQCPNWKKHLEETMNKGDVDFFQEWIGYNLYRGYPIAAFLILIGNGQNSKSIKMWVMENLLGQDNITTISLADITYDDFKRADVYQKLAVVSDEIGSTIIKNAGWLKSLSSGSRVTLERKFGQPFDAANSCKLTFACNEPPIIRDQSDAVKIRLFALDFPFQFVKANNGEELKPGQKIAREREEIHSELLAEMPGILNWAIEGLKRLMANKWKFSFSKSTEDIWKFYERRSNPVAAFIEEKLELTDNETDVTFKEEMWKAFDEWKENKGINLKVTRDRFFKDLKELDVLATQSKAHQSKRVYLCTKIKQDPPDVSYL